MAPTTARTILYFIMAFIIGYLVAYEDKNVRVIVANQQAGGVGVNLTAASYAIYYSRSFSLEADIQSEARNHRGGSEIHKSITRIDLVCPDTIDGICLEALYRKENLASNILKIRERI